VIRFLQGDREVALEARRADSTILDYLREDCRRRGTKEGCASGDCGACTVAVARPDGNELRYEPINACIATLGSLHGRQLITVEDLAEGETWHPVQRAMIECHASQCGFCTPGFVMSLFVLYHAHGRVDRAAIIEALGGNLCRCTGYRPILQAAEQALAEPRGDRFTLRATATLDRLRALEDTEADAQALSFEGTHYYRPETPAALAALLAGDAKLRIIAGGTDLLLDVTQGLTGLPHLVDLRAVPELRRIEVTEERIRLHAAVSHAAARPVILDDYPELAELIERFGSCQIRAQGTVAGNLANASPVGDWPPVFLALDARLCLESTAGRRDLAVGDFFLGYRETALADGEYLHSISVARRPRDLFLRAYKVSKRYEDDISSVCGVFALHIENGRIVRARVAFGGMAAIPARAPRCEAALLGLRLGADSMTPAARALRVDYTPISDVRASATYRSLVAERLLDRLAADYAGTATRVHGAPSEAPLHG